MPWTEADDARVRELCKTVDVGALTECPKCGMGSGGMSEMMLSHYCTHKYCPFREWRQAKEAADRAADPYFAALDAWKKDGGVRPVRRALNYSNGEGRTNSGKVVDTISSLLSRHVSTPSATLQTGKECDANSIRTGTVRSTGLDNAQPPSVMAGAEIPVAWGEFYGDKCASVTLKPGRFNTVPLYRSQPAMAGAEALLAIIDRLTGRSEGR